MISLKGKKILLGITGGIAAYKSCELLRLLVKAGAEVSVVMTENAQKFVGAPTFAALSGRPVATSLWDKDHCIEHIELASQADLVLVVPATANCLAKAANGIADDLLSNCLLARHAPAMFAPAMNKFMWLNPATQRNVETLKNDGCLFSGPDSGYQACGDTGEGRLREPEGIFADVARFFAPKLLAGRKVLITAGPTFECIDPVRGISNLSSGKQGYAIAESAFLAGADVTLVSGPTSLPCPEGVKRINVESAAEMLEACEAVCEEDNPQLFISVAAVGDWRPKVFHTSKMKKETPEAELVIEFVQNPDVLATIAARPNAPVCVGFAAETENIPENAQKKLVKKNAAMIVANDASAIGKDTNRVFLVEKDGITELEEASKGDIAREIVKKAASLVNQKYGDIHREG